VTGGNIFVLTPAGARSLASALGAPAPDPDPDPDAPIVLTELELSAVAEAANQMMAAAAGALGVVLGQGIQISPPDTRVLENPESAQEAFGTAPHATSTTFVIGGESCRLIQLVPSAFVARMVRAIDELGAEQAAAAGSPGRVGSDDEARDNETVGLQDALAGIKLRVWAELGRTRLPLGKALTLPLGAVVDLDRPADAPVDLFVNGLCFARGHLLITDDGEWGVCIDEVGTDGRAKRALAGAESNQPPGKAAVQ
jgi:flagellar motor switch protein FliN/FliY